MNSCILMAQIIKEPELRYTPDNQVPLAQMLVQFPALKPEDSPATLRVVGWGELAKEIQENFHEGDRVIIQGRLQINSVDRPEGFKEKRAELTVSKIYKTGEDSNFIAPTPQPNISSIPPTPAAPPPARTFTSPTSPEPDLDDIPF